MCLCVHWCIKTSSVDSKVVVVYFVKKEKKQTDFQWLFPDMRLMNANVFFFFYFWVCCVCMWLCSLLFFLSILQPKLILLICWHYHWIFCIQCLHCFDMAKIQLINFKKKTNYSTIALLNIFLGMNLSLWKTGVATPLVIFCPLVQHFPGLTDSVKAVWRWNFTTWQLVTFSLDTVFNVKCNDL